ncbi:hypothetical protein ELG97_37110 [Rhizobium leguminosarum]|uniref:hypothetical protein n=1 Tax=Rhizobium leguminosarum TaxID=384 RepID=UPI0010320C65|nr:hypothetical protein [Rhizobium leguminosarum]TBE73851.1 hypothetical protein ELG97_37110 [Rhizobium leguminosarum]
MIMRFGLIRIGIFGYLAYIALGAFVQHVYTMSYYREGCDIHACVKKGFGYQDAAYPAKVQRERDRNARALCPDYLNGNLLDQWVRYRDLSWCEDYRDRL